MSTAAKQNSDAAIAIPAIPTTWNGYFFRSRTEARWAVAFDALTIQYQYELEGYRFPDGTLYLPDFYLPQVGMWAEVKPFELTAEQMHKCECLVSGTGRGCLMLVGPPDFRTYDGLTLDCGEFTTTDYLLDIFWHNRKYYDAERRFYASTAGEFREPDDFSPQYQIAVEASRRERFDRRGVFPRPGHEPFSLSPAEMQDTWGDAR